MYRLHKRSHRYDVNMAAHTAKLAKRMVTIMKPYRFDDGNSVAVSFLGQFKRADDSNGLSEDVAMWILPYVMAKSPIAFVTILLNPRKEVNSPAIACQKIEG